jgi:Flp pilus assembly protein TadG
MKRSIPLRNTYRGQRGVTAIEFAILFPVFFAILYAIIQYGMIFAAQQTLTLAAEEGARAALQYQEASSTTAALTLRQDTAQQACLKSIGWLASVSSSITCVATTPSQTNCPNSSMYCVQVAADYPNYSAHPLIPTIALLRWAVPAKLGSSAIVQLDPANII